MARVKDPHQKGMLSRAAKKFNCSENDVLHVLVEMGVAWCILSHKSIVDREEIFSKMDVDFDEDPLFKALSDYLYNEWVKGGERIKQLRDGKN